MLYFLYIKDLKTIFSELYKELKQKIQELQKVIIIKNQNINDLKEKNENLNQEILELKEEEEIEKVEREAKGEKINHLSMLKHELQKECQNKDQYINFLRNENENLNQKINELQEECKINEENISNLQKLNESQSQKIHE